MQLETRVHSAWFQRLEPKYDKPLSSVSFSLNVRPYLVVRTRETNLGNLVCDLLRARPPPGARGPRPLSDCYLLQLSPCIILVSMVSLHLVQRHSRRSP